MANSPLQKGLEWVYNNFKKNTATMLVVTGTLGWGLSSLAQIGALALNPKISNEQKSFLIPQEFLDAVINISAFFLITQASKKFISKLASTGKIAPQKVRDFFEKNKDIYGDKVGKLSFDIDKVLAKTPSDFPKESYYTYKNYVTTLGTVGASVLASNIVTPILRNHFAADIQKKHLENPTRKPQNINQNSIYIKTSSNMKI